MSKRGKVIIIGGSIAGLVAAIALRARGFEVAIYERAGQALANRGAGIATQNELYDAMRSAGIELRDEMGVRSLGRIMLDVEGREIHRHDLPQIMTSWGLIYRFLRARIGDAEYNLASSLVDIDTNADGVTAVLQNGRRISADWLIGADGARSTVRGIVAPHSVPQYSGYFGWRGLIEEAEVAPATLTLIAQHMTFGMAPTGHWLGYLVAGPDDALEPGERRYNWGWYHGADEAMLRDHLTDSNGHYHAAGIPHDLIRPELVNAMRDEARRGLAPQIQAIIEATRNPFLQGMYDLGCDRLVHDRIILIGDAAFTARAHVGCGVAKAAEDAATLATALGGDDQNAALIEWEQARVQFGEAIVQWGRDLGSYIGAQPADAVHRAKANYHKRPDVLLAATAVVDSHRHMKL